ILCDGLGSRLLEEDSFFRTRRIQTISSVLPPATVAAETALAAGRNPVETGMLGWDMYCRDLDEIYTVFLNIKKGDPFRKPRQEAADYRRTHMKEKSIVDEINEQKKGRGYFLTPFQPDPYRDFDEMLERIESLCSEKGPKYIFAYDLQPDEILHMKGCDSKEAKETVLERNDKIESLQQTHKYSCVYRGRSWSYQCGKYRFKKISGFDGLSDPGTVTGAKSGELFCKGKKEAEV
ncbi:MAG: hypothetical protein HUJ54_11615, partial [Erysipelotrichaceae bacterium]|nr:hypothetical protein [Erysipelotrichaceae bacterium]